MQPPSTAAAIAAVTTTAGAIAAATVCLAAAAIADAASRHFQPPARNPPSRRPVYGCSRLHFRCRSPPVAVATAAVGAATIALAPCCRLQLRHLAWRPSLHMSLVSFYVGLPGGDTNAPTACAPGKVVFERNLEVPSVLW